MCLIKFELWEKLVSKELHLKGCYYKIVHVVWKVQKFILTISCFEKMNVSFKSMT